MRSKNHFGNWTAFLEAITMNSDVVKKNNNDDEIALPTMGAKKISALLMK